MQAQDNNTSMMTRQVDGNKTSWQKWENNKTTTIQGQNVEDKPYIQLRLKEYTKKIARKGDDNIFRLLEVRFKLFLVASPFFQVFAVTN